MAYSIPEHNVIEYPPEALKSFEGYGYEWIDNLHFLEDPSRFIDGDPARYVAMAKAQFRKLGWHGDGDVQLLWLPPFVFPFQPHIPPEGVILWHVKQQSDGISYLLSPIELPFEEFTSRFGLEDQVEG
ncbi:hypothetical protein [Stenotrophomonas sp.]|uniref:hypothetical protein n=1 Tax=Stenotrophomonas sp. TaxID=69392 RepID=UPI0028989901|nr:hypothetical protein [Stenotrophomonas sp.]